MLPGGRQRIAFEKEQSSRLNPAALRTLSVSLPDRPTRGRSKITSFLPGASATTKSLNLGLSSGVHIGSCWSAQEGQRAPYVVGSYGAPLVVSGRVDIRIYRLNFRWKKVLEGLCGVHGSVFNSRRHFRLTFHLLFGRPRIILIVALCDVICNLVEYPSAITPSI